MPASKRKRGADLDPEKFSRPLSVTILDPDESSRPLSVTREVSKFNEQVQGLIKSRVGLRVDTPRARVVVSLLAEVASSCEGKEEPSIAEIEVATGRTVSYCVVDPVGKIKIRKNAVLLSDSILYVEGDNSLGINPRFRMSDWQRYAERLGRSLICVLLPAVSREYSLRDRRNDLAGLINELGIKFVMAYSAGAADSTAVFDWCPCVKLLCSIAPIFKVQYRPRGERSVFDFFELPVILSGQEISTPMPTEATDIDTVILDNGKSKEGVEVKASHASPWKDRVARGKMCKHVTEAIASIENNRPSSSKKRRMVKYILFKGDTQFKAQQRFAKDHAQQQTQKQNIIQPCARRPRSYSI